MKNLIKGITVLLSTIFSHTTFAEIISIDNFHEIKNTVESLIPSKGNTELVAFDIDMTLIQPDHPAAYFPNIKKYEEIFKKITNGLTNEQRDLLLNLVVLNNPSRLIDSNTPDIISSLQKKGVKTIAFTSSLLGKVGNVISFEEWRYQRLVKFGLDFKNTFPNLTDVELNDLKVYRGSTPKFYKGILIANGERGVATKGEVLISFLRHCHEKPSLFILVDDQKKNLEEVQAALQLHEPNIRFLGIEYLTGLRYKSADITEEQFTEFWQGFLKQV